jgi:hypothetical protein
MRHSFPLVLGAVGGLGVAWACGGKQLEIGAEGGSGDSSTVDSRIDSASEDVGETSSEDVSSEDMAEASSEDVSDESSPSETGPLDSGACTDPADAAAFLGSIACVTCLSTKCPGGNLVEQCGCEPMCVSALACLDHCVETGGATDACAIMCLGEVDSSTASQTGSALLTCVGTSPASPCFSACTFLPDSGGTDGH